MPTRCGKSKSRGAPAFRPRTSCFTGVGKTPAELEVAVALGVKAINVESAGELARIEAIASKAGRTARVALRVNPDIDAKSHPHISTGLKINKFGMPVETARELLAGLPGRPHAEARRASRSRRIANHEPRTHPRRRAVCRPRWRAKRRVRARRSNTWTSAAASAFPTTEATPCRSPITRATLVEEIRPTGLPIVVEPGRSLVGPTAVLLAQVVDLKPRNAVSDFAVIDAGMTELMRPALYGAFHQIDPVRPGTSAARQYEIVGPVCESTDVVGRDRMLPPLEVGDLLAIRDAGAYGSAMASNYNRRPLPVEVLVDAGLAHVIRRRQTVTIFFRWSSE